MRIKYIASSILLACSLEAWAIDLQPNGIVAPLA